MGACGGVVSFFGQDRGLSFGCLPTALLVYYRIAEAIIVTVIGGKSQ